MPCSPLVVFPELFGLGNIFRLRGLVPAKQQQDQPFTLQAEIHTVSRPEIDSQLVNPLANQAVVTKIAKPGPV